MRCGVGDYTARLAEALSEDAGMKVSVLTSETDSLQETRAGGPHISRTVSGWNIKELRRIIGAVRQSRPDIIHLQFPTQGYKVLNGIALVPCLARMLLRVPVVLTWHEYVPPTFSSAARYMCVMALCADVIVVVRPDYRARMHGLIKGLLGRKPIRFIPNASIIPRAVLSPHERRTIRERLGCGTAKLVVFFGFSFPHKGVDLLFQIADPRQHHLLIIGELSPQDSYHSRLLQLAQSTEWKGKVTIAGFVEAAEAGKMLAAADAAVFPFLDGGGRWNSSLHAAASQGTFVVTTSSETNGYDGDANIYYARPNAVAEMRQALLAYQGVRRDGDGATGDPWLEVAKAHKELYSSLLNNEDGCS